MNGLARPATITVPVVAILLALSGCSDQAGEMSKAEACNSLKPAIATVTAGLNSTFSNLSTNPTAAVRKLDEVTADFDSVTRRITNPKIKRVGDRAYGSLVALGADVKRALANPKIADKASLESASNAVDKDFSAIEKACT